jgi:WD40 repeat protein/DNA-binding winged helix-turn-helix (wHTH) protein
MTLPPQIYQFESFRMDVRRRLLSRDGKPLPLRPKVFKTLLLLVQNAGDKVTKEQLMAEIWPDTIVNEDGLTRNISELRKTLGEDPKHHKFIVTLPGTGYCFVAKVTPLDELLDPDIVNCPYPGLEKFTEEYADLFFGRDDEIPRLIEKLRNSRFLAVVGASGSGKSSLVQAGLVPVIRKGGLLGSQTWTIRVLKPGRDPLRELAIHLLDIIPSNSSHGIESVMNQLLEEDTLHNQTLEASTRLGKKKCFVWIIDQFEEVFSLCKSVEKRAQFISNLLYAATHTDGQNVVILSLRSDFYAKCADYGELPESVAQQLSRLIADHQYLVTPLSKESMREAIEQPARHVGLLLEEGLTEKILDDMNNQPGALPLLAYTLLELYGRRKGRVLTYQSYRDAGGVENSIAQRAENIYSQFEPGEQRLAKQILLRLVRPGDGTEDIRRRANIEEFVTRPAERDSVEEVVHKLANARMLTTDSDEQLAVLVDISHEALIHTWPRLRDWINENRESIRIHHKLAESATEWQSRDRDEGVLYRGQRLVEIVEWLKSNYRSLNEQERDFIKASKEAHVDRERADSRSRTRTQVVGAGLAVILILTALAIYQVRKIVRQQRDVASSKQLAANALSELQIDPELGLLLAIEAVRIARNEVTENALRKALLSSHVRAAFLGHEAQVYNAALNREGTRMVTASVDKTARIWDLTGGHSPIVLSGHTRKVTCATFSPDGRLVATASEDKTARVWDVNTGQTTKEFMGHIDVINSVAFSPDNRLLLTASGDKTARVWNIATGQNLMELKGHKQWLNSATFSPDNKWIVTASGDKTVGIWETQTGKLLKELSNHTASVLNAAFSSDGKLLLTASADTTARIWETNTWDLKGELRGHTDNVNSAEFSPDNKWIVTASKDLTTRVWEASTGRMMMELRGHKSNINSAVFSPDGKSVITASGDRSVRVWDVTMGQRKELHGHTDGLWSGAFSPDGQLIVTAGKDKTARVWIASTGKLSFVLEGHTDAIHSVAFSPNGKLIATAGRDETVRIWDSATGRPLLELRKGGVMSSVAFSPDNRTVVTTSADRIARIWDLTSGQTLAELSGHTDQLNAATFSPDGGYIVTASRDNTARVWDARSGHSVSEIKINTGYVNSAEFSPDGRFILLGCGDNTARIWELKSNQFITDLRGHNGWINYAEYSPDARFVVTASGDRTVRIWDLSTNSPSIEWRLHEGSVTSATFSPDGKYVLTTSLDGMARIFACDICASIEETINLANSRVTRTLTTDERAKYFGS